MNNLEMITFSRHMYITEIYASIGNYIGEIPPEHSHITEIYASIGNYIGENLPGTLAHNRDICEYWELESISGKIMKVT